jgi:DNA repair exonuclease SbcCD ATPase subunit
MRLEELVVEDFRKLAGRHVVRPATAGITVVSGDNEEGKSTLLDALKRAFFMKHNTTGEARDLIQPLGRSVTPAVAVTFRIGAAAFRLEKQFRRGGVRLEGPNGTLEGDAAELELARLLAFDWPGRGAAKTEHMGLAGLFWVDQGTTFDADQQPSPTALRSLEPALAGQLAVLGRGERAPRLMAEVRRRREQHFTGARGQKRGELAELEKAMTALRAELDLVAAEERAVEGLLDRLAQSIERRRAALAADHLGRARAEVERTGAARHAAKALEERAQAKTLERQVALSELARWQEKRRQRQAMAADIAAKTAERAKLLEDLAEAAPSLAHARQQRSSADAAAATARAKLEALEQRQDALARQAARLRLQREVASLERAAEAVQAAARAALEHDAAAAAEPLTPETLAELEAMATSLGENRAALRAVATRLVLRPERADAKVTLDGTPLDPAQPLELTAPAVLVIEGFGRIEVTPGGERLAALHRRIGDQEQALAAGLRAVRAADLATARRRSAAKETHGREAAAARQRLADHLAACGMVDQSALEAAGARARTRLAALDGVVPAEGRDEAALEAALESAERAVNAARSCVAETAERCRAAAADEAALAKATEQQSFAETRLAIEIASCEEKRAIETDELSDQTLEQRLAAAQLDADRAATEAAMLERELARADPDHAATAAEQAARRLQQLEEEARKLEREVHDLEAELRGRGAKGVGDRKAELEGSLERTERRHLRVLAEAEAWRLLDDTLESVDRARQDALVAPLEARVRPYLRQLLGEAELGFEAQRLQLDRLARGAAIEPFHGLSVGTREQLAVLVRLAIGDLLAETTGQSPPLILDDALVYADAVRLGRMKTILEAAAKRQQIIILTCRKEDYLGLDARYLTLEDCRSET